ncbi:MAG: rhodanese-like domain-containing protein [Cyanobacteria bacterium P01_A01_bin.45]
MSGNSFQSVSQISVEELKDLLKGDKANLQLIDVREPQEIAIANLDDFINLPLSQFNEWIELISSRFDPHQETLVLCHHGVRSAQMCQWLLSQGFTNVKNISGGIDAYSRIVDSSIPQY